MNQVRSGEFRKSRWRVACSAAVSLAAALGAGQAYGLVVDTPGGGALSSSYPSNTVGYGVQSKVGGGFVQASVEGWNYVGQGSDASVVYLGNGWAATAEHVVATMASTSTVNFYTDTVLPSPSQEVATTLIGGSAVQIINPQFASSTTDPNGNGSYYQYNYNGVDLAVFKVSGWNAATLPDSATNPLVNLASVKLLTPSGGPSAGTASSLPVTMIGMGGVTGSYSYWNVNQGTNPWTWTSESTSSSPTNEGAVTITNKYGPVKVWGTNTTTAWSGGANDQMVITPSGFSVSIRTNFYSAGQINSPGTTFNVASLASGDSGGGMFDNVNQLTWPTVDTPTLVGINLGTTPADSWMTAAGGSAGKVNVPTVPSVAPFGTVSDAVDVTFYEQQIIQATTEWGGATTGTWSATSSSSSWRCGWSVSGGGTSLPTALQSYFKAPNGIGASAQFLDLITAPTTVTLGSTVILGVLTFNNANVVTITGASGEVDFNNGVSNSDSSAPIRSSPPASRARAPITWSRCRWCSIPPSRSA